MNKFLRSLKRLKKSKFSMPYCQMLIHVHLQQTQMGSNFSYGSLMLHPLSEPSDQNVSRFHTKNLTDISLNVSYFVITSN